MKTGVRGGFAGVARMRGFTIVETMVVLAVTGALFIAIAATLTGRQNSAEFTHAIQSAQSQIQQTINQVAEGFYPNRANFSCAASGGTVQLSAGATTQGANQDCVFLGKVIQFDVQGTDPEQYQIYTITGLRCGVSAPVSCPAAGATTPFQNTSPTVVGVANSYTNYSDTKALEYGLTTVWVRSDKNSSCTTAACSIGSVGFLMEPGSLDGTSTTGYSSGAQPVDLIPLPGTTLSQLSGQAVTAINSRLQDATLTADAPINPTSGVQICLASGSTNQSGLITIGSTGRQLAVKLDIKGNTTCS